MLSTHLWGKSETWRLVTSTETGHSLRPAVEPSGLLQSRGPLIQNAGGGS